MQSNPGTPGPHGLAREVSPSRLFALDDLDPGNNLHDLFAPRFEVNARVNDGVASQWQIEQMIRARSRAGANLADGPPVGACGPEEQCSGRYEGAHRISVWQN